MVLTFEVNNGSMHVHCDAEGRDHLISKLSSLGEPRDHYHLFMEPGGNISAKRFDADGTAMEMVTLYMMSSDAEPVALEGKVVRRLRDGKAEWVECVGGVEQSSDGDEQATELLAKWRREQSEKLYCKLFEAGCIKFGEFRLKSGILSPVYVDFRGLISNPQLLQEVGRALGMVARQIGCDRVAGIPYAGLPLGVAASMASNIPMIYPRKEVKDYGTRKLIEGAYSEGEKVLVIDDIITDGASKIEAIKPLEEAGLVVKDVLIILDREQGGNKVLAKAGYQLHSLGTLSQVLDTLVRAGKVSPDMQQAVARFIGEHQFA